MKRKVIVAAVCAVLFCGCRNSAESSVYVESAIPSAETESEDIMMESSAVQSESTAVPDVSSDYEKPIMTEPEFELLSANSINITSGLENVDSVNIYLCETSSANNGSVSEKLVYSAYAEDFNRSEDGYTIEFDADNIISEAEYAVDNSEVKTDYYAKGIKLGFVRGNEEITSDCIPIEVRINTGTVNQYDAALRGDTACGAASGTLLLQSVLPVWDSELTRRMSAIRDYSAVSFDYSVGADFNYYMSGEQIANSVNKYLEDSGIDGFEITDFRTEMSTEETLIELISTARPAVLEVCYADGRILEDYEGFSHWITVNGFRLTDSGYEFRWENTIGCEQNWVSSELLDDANRNVTYNSVDFQPTRYIAALENAVAGSLI